MTDPLTKEQRSWNMSRIRSRNTTPEILVRSLLHRLGFRFSLRRKELPGKPDLVLPRHRIVLFVHGCFWHRHRGCRKATTPGTHVTFWRKKFKRNVERDTAVRTALETAGWKVAVIWECEVRTDSRQLVDLLLARLGLAPRTEVDYDALPSQAQLRELAETRAEWGRGERGK